MSESEETTSISGNKWLVESLRLTWIVDLTSISAPGLSGDDSARWWAAMTSNAESTQSYQPKKGIFQDDGSVAGGHFSLTTTTTFPVRLDFMFSGQRDLAETELPFSPLPDFAESSRVFRAMLEKFLPTAPRVQRIAIGGAFVQKPVDDTAKAIGRIAEFASSLKVDRDAKDLFYQINRPRRSTSVPDLTINRLMRFQILQFHRMAFVGGPGAIPTTPNITARPTFFARLDTDVNNLAPSSGYIPPECYNDLIAELFGMTEEIMQKGEIP